MLKNKFVIPKRNMKFLLQNTNSVEIGWSLVIKWKYHGYTFIIGGER
jgi:hypothetical protein